MTIKTFSLAAALVRHQISGALEFLLADDHSDLTVRQLSTLLACAKQPQTVRGLAITMGVSKPAITRAADKLQGLKLLTRTPDKKDKRSVFLSLTKAGQAFASNFS